MPLSVNLFIVLCIQFSYSILCFLSFSDSICITHFSFIFLLTFSQIFCSVSGGIIVSVALTMSHYFITLLLHHPRVRRSHLAILDFFFRMHLVFF